MLNFVPKTRQKNDYAVYARMGNGMESTHAYDRQREQLQTLITRRPCLYPTKTFQTQCCLVIIENLAVRHAQRNGCRTGAK